MKASWSREDGNAILSAFYLLTEICSSIAEAGRCGFALDGPVARHLGACRWIEAGESKARKGGDKGDSPEGRSEIARRDRRSAVQVRGSLHHEGTESHAHAEPHLLGRPRQAGGIAHVPLRDVRISNGVEARELERAEAAADQKNEHDQPMRRRGREEAV